MSRATAREPPTFLPPPFRTPHACPHVAPLKTPPRRRRLLAKTMGIDDYASSKKSEVLLELYQNNLNFSKAQGFSPECTSTFFSILKSTFDQSMGPPPALPAALPAHAGCPCHKGAARDWPTC